MGLDSSTEASVVGAVIRPIRYNGERCPARRLALSVPHSLFQQEFFALHGLQEVCQLSCCRGFSSGTDLITTA